MLNASQALYCTAKNPREGHRAPALEARVKPLLNRRGSAHRWLWAERKKQGNKAVRAQLPVPPPPPPVPSHPCAGHFKMLGAPRPQVCRSLWCALSVVTQTWQCFLSQPQAKEGHLILKIRWGGHLGLSSCQPPTPQLPGTGWHLEGDLFLGHLQTNIRPAKVSKSWREPGDPSAVPGPVCPTPAL